MGCFCIGCDMGGLLGVNDGLAIAYWDGRELAALSAQEGKLFAPLPEDALALVLPGVEAGRDQAVIGIDGSLGWPAAFHDLVGKAGGPGQADTARQWEAAREIDSPFLYRETERFVREYTGKFKPLTGVGDRFGNNCTKAQLLMWRLKAIFEHRGCRVVRPPFDPAAPQAPVTIVEVYPKLRGLNQDFAGLSWPGETATVLQLAAGDASDAKVAALMAACFAKTVGMLECGKLPSLIGPEALKNPPRPGFLAGKIKREGWIYFPPITK